MNDFNNYSSMVTVQRNIESTGCERPKWSNIKDTTIQEFFFSIERFFFRDYEVFTTSQFEIIYGDGTKETRPYAISDDYISMNNPDNPRFKPKIIPEDKEAEQTEYTKLINDLNQKGYFADQKYIALFFNKKIEQLFLNKRKR